MKPTTTLAEAALLGGTSLTLVEHDGQYFLQSDGRPLQSSFAHGTPLELGRLASQPFRPVRQPSILVGGLGLGYALAALRENLPQKRATFLVAEAVRELPDWHRRFLDPLHPGQMEDPRVVVRREGLPHVLKKGGEPFHAIVLDVDGSPFLNGVTDRKGILLSSFLNQAHSALKEGGLLAVACANDAASLERRLRQAGFDVAHQSVPSSHKGKQKRRSSIWLARRGSHHRGSS